MNELNIDWEPSFGTIYTWFAMDKNGRIAVMVNNCWGCLPRALLSINDCKKVLDELNQYLWEESINYQYYPINKKGKTILNLYSKLVYSHMEQRKEVEQWIAERSDNSQRLREYSLPAIKGVFIYHGVEGCCPGEDYPVGYDGETKMGDYFSYLMPTIYASIDDFPEELRHGIAVSDTIDFTVDRLLDNDKTNEYFPRMYQK